MSYESAFKAWKSMISTGAVSYKRSAAGNFSEMLYHLRSETFIEVAELFSRNYSHVQTEKRKRQGVDGDSVEPSEARKLKKAKKMTVEGQNIFTALGFVAAQPIVAPPLPERELTPASGGDDDEEDMED